MHFSEFLCRLSDFLRRFPGQPAAALLTAGLVLGIPTPHAWAGSDVAALLDAAEAAERTGHLIYPARGSAMSLYHEVLYEEPENAHALEGLTRLAEHYLVQAQASLDSGDLLQADGFVSQARMIYPDYPAVAAMQRQIERLETAERTRQTLDWRQVAEQSAKLVPALEKLGRKAKSGDCRVTIQVSNDGEGRWIYQQMNRASGDGRLRAEVKIASPAAVDILCFTAEEDTNAAS